MASRILVIYRNMATDTMSLVEKSQEIAREHWWKVNTALATLLLTCQMSMNTALAADPAQNQAPVAVSAPPTAKGYWQEVTLKDGSTMSFANLLKMKDGKEKEEIINGLTDAGFSAYEKYIDINKQVANQRIEEKKWVAEAANQETIQLRIANVAKLKILAEKNWWKLSKSDEKYLKNIIADGKPPIDEAKYILSKAIFP